MRLFSVWKIHASHRISWATPKVHTWDNHRKYPLSCFQHDEFSVNYHPMSSVQSLSHVWLFVSPWIAIRQASLSITNSQSSLKLMSIKSVMPSNHFILCRPLLLLPPILPSIRVFSNESTLRMRWQKYWNFSFSISPSSEYPGLITLRMDWFQIKKGVCQGCIWSPCLFNF